MKKNFIAILALLSAIVAYASREANISANGTNVQSHTRIEMKDCKKVGGVTIEIDYNYSYKYLWVKASNSNKYRTSISYKLMATNGVVTYPVDSGMFDLAAYPKDGYCKAGPHIYMKEGFSYYLDIQEPIACD